MIEGRRNAIAEAMAKHGWTPAGPGVWATTLTNGAAVPVAARLDPHWLNVEAEIDATPDVPLLERLRTNAVLPSPVRLVLSDHPDPELQLRLTADLAADGRGDWVSRIAGVTGAIADGLHTIHSWPTRDDSVERASALPESVGDVLREAAWEEAVRDESSLSVALGEESNGATAQIEARGQALVAWVTVARNISTDDTVHSIAVATFMLLAAHRLRSVRAAARREGRGDALTIGWECRLPREPDAVEVDRALTALAVAHAVSHREVAALASPVLSERYLSLRGTRPQSRVHIAAAS